LIEIKQQLYTFCCAYVAHRIETIQKAIGNAQASSKEETKSSAGDKYETGRAMMQLEIEHNTIQLAEAKKLEQIMDNVQRTQQGNSVQLGSLVILNNNNFYIAISAGQLKIGDKLYTTVSAQSPIGMKMMGMQTGASFTFNNRTSTVLEIG